MDCDLDRLSRSNTGSTEATKLSEINVVYSLSDKGSMPSQLKDSISSLVQHLPANQVHVISTPPHIDAQLQHHLDTLGVNVYKYPNTTPFFEMRPGKGGYYGEKIAQLSTIDAENVLLLDCDTQILDHPEKLFQEDFDVSARVGSGFLEFNFNAWNQMFTDHGKTPIPMMNSGCVVFQNQAHTTIGREALEYIQQNEWPEFHHKRHYDQYALTLAASGHRIKWMNRKHHAFRWEYEPHDTVVYHGQRRKPLLSIGVKLLEIINYVT